MVNIHFDQSNEQLKKELEALHIADLAIVFDQATSEEQARIFQLLEKDIFIHLIPELSHETVKKLFQYLLDDDLKQVLNGLESDDLKDVLFEFQPEEQERYLELLDPKEKESMIKLLSYDEEVAASFMSTDFIHINQTMSIKEATNDVIKTVLDKDYLDTIFVTDNEQKLLGILDVKDLIIARPNDDLHAIMTEKFPYVLEDASIDLAVTKIRDYDLNVLPVLNHDHQLLGIITSDDVLDYMAEEHESDYQAIVAVSGHTDELSPLQRSKQRLPWLLISVIMNLVIASFLSVFQTTLEQVVALVLFQPMILGMAGNIGTQSLAVTILGIHSKELSVQKHVWKELLIALINSAIIGILAVLIVWVFLTILPFEYTDTLKIGMVVGLSLFGSMFISSMASVFLPITLNKLGFDESAASGPMISTVNDFTALGTYFLIATLLLIN